MSSLRPEARPLRDPDETSAQAERIADVIVAQSRSSYGNMVDEGAGAAMAAASEQVLMALVPALQRRIAQRVVDEGREDQDAHNWFGVLSGLLPESRGADVLPWSPRTLGPVLDGLADALRVAGPAWDVLNVRRTIGQALRVPADEPELRRAFRDLALALYATAEERDQTKYHRDGWEAITEHLGQEEIVPADVWRRALDAPTGPLENALRELAATAPAKPSARFRARAEVEVRRLGTAECGALLSGWLRTLAATVPPADHPPSFPAATVERVIGVVQIADVVPGAAITSALADLAICGYRKVRAVGARCAPVATICTKLLADRPDALPELARVQHHVTHPTSRTKVARVLADVAERLGVTSAELEEIVVPDHDLDPAGEHHRTVAGVRFDVVVDGGTVTGTWTAPNGKPRKTPPAELKSADPDAAAAQRALLKDLREALPVQRRRVEALLREDRQWPLNAWRVRYAEHPLVGTIARRLVWRFADERGEHPGIWVRAEAIGPGGTAIALRDDTVVRLWHPVGARDDEAAVLAALLSEFGRRGPFPQVDRETWRPPAGRARHEFHGRRVRQGAMAAVLRERGWAYELRSALWDADDVPTLRLPAWDLTAAIDLHDDLDDQDDPTAAATTDAGILLHVELREIAFTNAAGEPVAVHDVPAVAYSEVVRDVALVAAAAGETTAVE